MALLPNSRNCFFKRVSVPVYSLVYDAIVAAKVFCHFSQRTCESFMRNLLCTEGRGFNGFLNRHSFRYTGVKHFVVDAKMFGYLLECSSETKRLGNHIGSRVISLLLNGCPSAVARLVVPINVNPVESVISRRLPHVG